MNAVTAGIFSALNAAVRTNRKMNQKATVPINFEGLAPGLNFSTYSPAVDSCRALSSPTASRPLVTRVRTTLAISQPTSRISRKPIRLGMKPKKELNPSCRLDEILSEARTDTSAFLRSDPSAARRSLVTGLRLRSPSGSYTDFAPNRVRETDLFAFAAPGT